MDGIKLMVEEHKYIKRMLLVIRKASYGIVKGENINFDDFFAIIDFVRNYADNHHHGKEEKLLFTKMVDEIGDVAEVLVKYGMHVEHDLGRLFMRDLEEALIKVKNGDDEAKIDVISNAVSYTHLLTRHINKEDNTVYTFAQRKLSKETLNTINIQCEAFEKEEEEKQVQHNYIMLLESLEKKYLG
jgi:hemerythrin-like domain-containing protein